MKELKATLLYNWNNRFRDDGTAPISLRIYYAGKRKLVHTGFAVLPKNWNEHKMKVTGIPNAVNVNIALQKQMDRAREIFREMVIRGEHITAEKVAARLTHAPSEDFPGYIGRKIAENNSLSASTINQHKTFLSWLKKKYPELPFVAVSYARVSEFEQWLLGQQSERKKPLHRNYVSKMLDIMRRYCRLAIKEGLLSSTPFDGRKIKRKKKETVWLTLEEVELIEGLDLSGSRGRIAISKDMFLFACYTGIRFGDMCKLRVKDIPWDGEGLRLKYSQQKTGAVVEIPLYSFFWGKPERLVSRYLEDKQPEDLVFGYIYNKTYNDTLSEKIAKPLDIRKHLTSHVARHTCAMGMLNLGFSIEEVSKALGHESIQTTEIYARLHQSSLDKAAKRVFGRG